MTIITRATRRIPPLHDAGRQMLRTTTLLTSSFRPLPDFLIIGSQRGGTTTLFRWLSQHPQVRAPRKKEIHYFDWQSERPLAWYRSYFPLMRSQPSSSDDPLRLITGEATPYYLVHPTVPARVARTLPRVRIIALLRDPVARAYSHYQHEVDHGDESLTFEEAIDCEAQRLAGEEERLASDPAYYSFNHHHYSYVTRGYYVDQLLRWNACFPREQMLILKSEDLYARPADTMRRVTDFLRIEPWDWPAFPPHNSLEYEAMSPATVARLREHYRPHNQRLYDYLGVDLGWDSGASREDCSDTTLVAGSTL